MSSAKLIYDPRRGIVMRVLSGVDEGCEFVLPVNAIRMLPGAPPRASAPLPETPAAAAAAAAVAPVAGLSLSQSAPGEAAVLIRWDGGGESSVPIDDFKRRCDEAAESAIGLPGE